MQPPKWNVCNTYGTIYNIVVKWFVTTEKCIYLCHDIIDPVLTPNLEN